MITQVIEILIKGGNKQLVLEIPVPVYGGDDRMNALTNKISEGESFKIGNLNVECIFTPCHTSGHICYLVEKKAVFTGDTLFVGGCGRFFEGNAQQMYEALVKKLCNLPDETLVYCGHEYTRANLEFASTVEPKNSIIMEALTEAKGKSCTVPSSIGREKQINPFCRVEISEELREKWKGMDGAGIMHELRELKNKL